MKSIKYLALTLFLLLLFYGCSEQSAEKKERGEVMSTEAQWDEMSLIGTAPLLPNGVPRSIRIGMGNWDPFYGKCLDGRSGFIVEILTEIFTAEGIDVDFFIMSFSRALADTRKGKYHGIIAIGKETAPDFYFSKEEIGAYQYCYYTRVGDNWNYSGKESLASRKTAVIKFGSMAEDHDFIHDPKNQHLFVAVTFTENYMDQVTQMLTSGRVDTFVNERIIIPYYVKHHPKLKGKIRYAGGISVRPLRIGFSPVPELSTQVEAIGHLVDKGIIRIRKSGKLSEIMGRYGVEVWKKKDLTGD